MQIEIVTGAAADRLLADPELDRQWRDLYADCPWGTVLQSPDFAQAWYQSYRPVFEPVLVLGHRGDRRLVGLLAAAYAPRKGLVMVGAHQAEYHTWLATPEHGDSFAAAAFYALGRRYPSSSLTLKYLPPGTPLGWLDGAYPAARYCVVTTLTRSIMNLRDKQAMQRCRKQRSIRYESRMRRLRSIGYTGLQRITDPAELDRQFDQIIAWHDFRRAASSGIGVFELDPMKRAFHCEMLRRGVLCVTAMKLGDRTISVQFDMLGRKVMHRALGAYAPDLAKLALGKIHILELTRLLQAEGYDCFDLTPGDDRYKGELATTTEPVHTLTVSPGWLTHQKSRASQRFQRVARWALHRMGSDTDTARIMVRNLRSRPLATILRPLRHLLGRWRSTPGEMVVYAVPASRLKQSAAPTAAHPVRFDAPADWLMYHPIGFEIPRHQTLLDAARRYADGMRSYTMVHAHRLRFNCWLAEEPEAVLAEHGLAMSNLGDRVVLLQDLCIYGGDRAALLESGIAQAALDASDRTGAGTIAVLVRGSDHKMTAALERLGFRRSRTKSVRVGASGGHVAPAVHG